MPATLTPRQVVPARSPEAPPPSWQVWPRAPRSAPAEHDENRRRHAEWRERLVSRVRAEFTEMPGMHLNLIQAQRLFGLRRDVCERILEGLVEEGYLCHSGIAVYARRDFT